MEGRGKALMRKGLTKETVSNGDQSKDRASKGSSYGII